MKDRERGVVWEETIIFLEDETKMVRGSANLSNNNHPNESSQTCGHAHLHQLVLNFSTLPPKVFLSATLSNASEFAAWVAHLHKQPCHVVYTDYRPTPLQVWPSIFRPHNDCCNDS